MTLPPSTVKRAPPTFDAGAPRIGTTVRLRFAPAGGCTPGSSLASSRKLRPFNGSPSSWSRVITPPTAADSYCICGEAAATVTASFTSATRS